MNAIENIREHIKQAPLGKPILASSLNGIASPDNIRQILSRMVKNGEIERVARGIFVRPKKIAYLGKVLPESEEIAKAVAETTGEIIVPNGAEAARLLHLSTQVPMKPIFYTSGNTRHIKVKNLEITLKHITPRKLVKPGTPVGLVIAALWYLGKSNVNEHVIEKIKHQLKPKQFAELFKHTSQMPGWMAAVFYHYQTEKNYVR
jgi:hypothetical protein